MNGRLENKCRGFDEKDIKKLSRAFDRLDKNASITPDEQDRILSSVMRKAGIEMEERTKDKIKVTGRGFSAIAAAAAVLVLGVGVIGLSKAAGGGFDVMTSSALESRYTPPERAKVEPSEQEIIDGLYGGEFYDYIVKNKLDTFIEGEDKDFKISVNGITSDGELARMRVRIEGKSDKAKEYTANEALIELNFFYADTKAFIKRTGRGSEQPDETQYCTDTVINELEWLERSSGADLSRPIVAQIAYDDFEDNSAYDLKKTDTPVFDEKRAYVTLDLSYNVKARKVISEDGLELTLTPISIYGNYDKDKLDRRLVVDPSDMRAYYGYTITPTVDGRKEEPRYGTNSQVPIDYTKLKDEYGDTSYIQDTEASFTGWLWLTFNSPIDIDKCTEIDYCGVIFKVEK